MRIQGMRFLVVVVAVSACSHSPRAGGGGGGGQSASTSGPVPADVRKTVEATLGPTLGPSARISPERERGVTIYEAAVQTKLELELSDAGKLQKTEIALPVATLPTAVTAALAGKGTISEAEVVVMPSGVAFAVEIGNTEFLIDATGKILEQEQEAEEPGDDED